MSIRKNGIIIAGAGLPAHGYETVTTSDASLTMEVGKAYVWTVNDSTATLAVDDSQNSNSYEIPVVITLTTGTVTFSGITIVDSLLANKKIYGAVVKNGGVRRFYIYDFESLS